MRGVFVTGTGTGVGKSVLAAAICARLADRGDRVAAFKPAVTGLDEPAGDWPPDHELLASAASAGQRPEDVGPHRFGPPVSPHFAAKLAGTTLDPFALATSARHAADGADAVVVEGVGGLMVPLTPDYLVRDLARDLTLPLVVAAAPGVGTISHSLLTLEAAGTAGLRVVAVILTPWPERPNAVERSNRDTIARLGEVAVEVLPWATPKTLAEAAAGLPVERWLG